MKINLEIDSKIKQRSKTFDQVLLGTKHRGYNFSRGRDDQGQGLKSGWQRRSPQQVFKSSSYFKLHFLGSDTISIVIISFID